MRSPVLPLDAFTHRRRDEATTLIRDAVSEAGAAITNVVFFSNLATCFLLSLELGDLPALRAALVATGLRFSEASDASIGAAWVEGAGPAAPSDPRRHAEIDVALHVMFIHDEPDMKREVPAVPG